MGQDFTRTAMTTPNSFSKVENSWTASIEYYSSTRVPEASSRELLESTQSTYLIPVLIGLAVLCFLLLMSLLGFFLVIYV